MRLRTEPSLWLTTKGIHHTWVQTPGQHSFRIWRRNLAQFSPLLFQEQNRTAAR